VYVPRVAAPNLYDHTVGAWLWSERRGVITGRAASAIHGSRWIDPNSPVELLWRNYRPPSGIITRDERFTCDDVVEIDGMPVATPQRAAYDIGRFLTRGTALEHLDALAAATGLAAEHVAPLIDRYPGARHLRRLREVIDLMDGGAQSPKETWLRLLQIDARFPRPTTQIPVLDDFGHPFAFLDMGWEDLKIAIEYDGDQHRSDTRQFDNDVLRLEGFARAGWTVVRVVGRAFFGDRPECLRRVRHALAQGGWHA
jgi:hypothetical protein